MGRERGEMGPQRARIGIVQFPEDVQSGLQRHNTALACRQGWSRALPRGIASRRTREEASSTLAVLPTATAPPTQSNIWVPMCRTEDNVSRILAKMLRTELAPFFEDADRKLGEPARRQMSSKGRLTRSFQDIFTSLHEVVLNLDHYADAIEVRKGQVRLSEEKDRAAVFRL